ncbi:unnamed protein product, partial [Mesorhabditis belari]|uniref:Apple domain-containing protein n=1 Tax=Mesorhabditis belari TaxID=2138241 RepID=A0AAF3E9R2_9BILA
MRFIFLLLFPPIMIARQMLRDEISSQRSEVLKARERHLVNYFDGVTKRKERRKDQEEKFQNYQLPSSYGGGSSYGLPPKPYKPDRIGRSRVSKDSETKDRQLVAGVPDASDPCFRRYANAIIVNAQPYERRSSTKLAKCKRHCLESQLGLYSCRSFVYDNVNQVCDLFAHVGDQAPAKLLKFQTRDYYEPTGAVQCDIPESTSTVTENTSTIEAETPAVTEDDIVTDSSIDSLTDIDGFRDDPHGEPSTYGPSTTSYGSSSSYGPVTSTTNENDISIDTERSISRDSCAKGKTTRFLRTADFELYKNDDVTIDVSSVDECVDACTNNEVNEQPLDCKSFDYTEGHCSLTVEAAVPLGTGQLKQNRKSEYYEKICIDEELAEGCPKVFARYPQMILVGFAESVTDAPSFEECFHNCLNSFTLYGFNCTSGMYYFEENQLNCILNTEDRHSQADLFAEENTDIVDYFEVGCQKRPTRPRAFGLKTAKRDDPTKSEKLVTAEETATEWSECADGVQHRRRDCADKSLPCGLESRPCSTTGALDSMNMEKLKSAIKKLKCPVNVCCKVFDSCQLGLMRNSRKRKVEWCRHPC